jgi:SAM-dependent methyltransferase
MAQTDLSIYDDPEFAAVDVGTVMRQGHPDIVGGDQHLVSEIQRLQAARGRPLTVVDIGSGSGDLTTLIAQQVPGTIVTAIEPAGTPAAQAAKKADAVEGANVFHGRFEEWTTTVDVAISWGSHHHLPHDYLEHARTILGPDGALLIGDEFAPEYLTATDIARLGKATIVSLVDGFVFDSEVDIGRYRQTNDPGKWRLDLEQRRRQSLWQWYKFVGDYAIERDSWDVALAELAIAKNDLTTDYSGEHKTSPKLLERELQLAGFDVAREHAIGDRPRELQSFVVYTCHPAASVDR